MAEIPTTCEATKEFQCHFAEEERLSLKALASKKEYVSFPKWALSALIAILFALGASNAAIWVELGQKATSEDVKLVRVQLEAKLILLQERVSIIENTIPKDYPPKWFEKQFYDLVSKVDDNNKILTDLRIEVRALTADAAATKKGP